MSSLLYNYFPFPFHPFPSLPYKELEGGEVLLPYVSITYINEYSSEMMTEL